MPFVIACVHCRFLVWFVLLIVLFFRVVLFPCFWFDLFVYVLCCMCPNVDRVSEQKCSRYQIACALLVSGITFVKIFESQAILKSLGARQSKGHCPFFIAPSVFSNVYINKIEPDIWFLDYVIFYCIIHTLNNSWTFSLCYA